MKIDLGELNLSQCQAVYAPHQNTDNMQASLDSLRQSELLERKRGWSREEIWFVPIAVERSCHLAGSSISLRVFSLPDMLFVIIQFDRESTTLIQWKLRGDDVISEYLVTNAVEPLFLCGDSKDFF
jgi:hypothetical protein